MLIQIEEGISAMHWIVTLDGYPVTCRSWQEAHEFAERMQARLDAPHPLPVPDGDEPGSAASRQATH